MELDKLDFCDKILNPQGLFIHLVVTGFGEFAYDVRYYSTKVVLHTTDVNELVGFAKGVQYAEVSRTEDS